ncbi:hypothetical protein OIU74_003567 [Salix koriyanagi]|uniref:Uncharacterized protein n=1 Tax=Salix koriyanagi TaxID=2511006 RepID=A0A9Q0ZL78_9ROSI|nr:hypothetical protein OIU74_003567 [Salix koriyanagi]
MATTEGSLFRSIWQSFNVLSDSCSKLSNVLTRIPLDSATFLLSSKKQVFRILLPFFRSGGGINDLGTNSRPRILTTSISSNSSIAFDSANVG